MVLPFLDKNINYVITNRSPNETNESQKIESNLKHQMVCFKFVTFIFSQLFKLYIFLPFSVKRQFMFGKKYSNIYFVGCV